VVDDMATGFDELIDFLLSEIALCGTEGMWVRSSNLSLARCLGATFGGRILYRKIIMLVVAETDLLLLSRCDALSLARVLLSVVYLIAPS
jgi:hypothetical protein